MSNTDRINEAMEIALSCKRCGSPTDAEFISKTAVWVTRCECGKTDKYLGEYIAKEAQELTKTLHKKKK